MFWTIWILTKWDASHSVLLFWTMLCLYMVYKTHLMHITWKQKRTNMDYVHWLLGEAFFLMDMHLYFIQTFVREQIFTKLSNILMFTFLWGLKVKDCMLMKSMNIFFVYLVSSLKRSLHPCNQHWVVFVSMRPYFIFF